MIQILIGFALIVAGAVLAYAANSKGKRLAALKETPTVTCAEVAGLAGSMVEVAGQAIAGPQGTLTAPLSNQPCLWHRVQVVENYTERDSNGVERREQRTLSDIATESSFGIRDSSGRVLIDTRNANVDSPEKTRTATSGNAGGIANGISIGGFSLGGNNSNVEETEWIIRERAQLFVSGISGKGEYGVQIAKPDGRELLISTRDEAAIMKSASQGQVLFYAGAAIAVLIGLALIATGI